MTRFRHGRVNGVVVQGMKSRCTFHHGLAGSRQGPAIPVVARRAPAAAVAARNLVDEHGGQYFKAADAARIKNNVVRGLGAACGGRADLLRAIPSEDDHVFSKTPGETTKTPGDTLADLTRSLLQREPASVRVRLIHEPLRTAPLNCAASRDQCAANAASTAHHKEGCNRCSSQR